MARRSKARERRRKTSDPRGARGNKDPRIAAGPASPGVPKQPRVFLSPEDLALSPRERECFERHPDLARLLPHLDEIQRKPKTIAEMCRLAIVEPAVLRRLIKSATGRRPHELAMRCSIRDVARALRASIEPIDDIRARLGYRSESALCRAFTRIVGCSPREYRRRHFAADDLASTD